MVVPDFLWSSPFGLRSGIDLPEDKDLGIAVRNVIHVRRCASPATRTSSTAAPGRLFASTFCRPPLWPLRSAVHNLMTVTSPASFDRTPDPVGPVVFGDSPYSSAFRLSDRVGRARVVGSLIVIS